LKKPTDPWVLDAAKRQRAMMTRAEALFWSMVRAHRLGGSKWRRQAPLGPYVVDFLCEQLKLVVELDGPPHETAEARAKDASRDRWLADEGYTVLRIMNDELLGNPGAIEKRLLLRLGPSPGPR
jgi:very-short-patch-repair endonuclease